eukprot:CAMPEP_0118891944 /NCGR_PEP_ID=MMETSP1166-20130328/1738_1 /TAXON_ID=1104430 /ORGANISM="Chrysoreinhardia sp, Strain CCMP3193" /LENGTH=1813 /DNA_ID=CAMNT_0006830625 /DNA_START=444 /DNA_END=5888 /DNA_ORIENTATION=+
MTELKCDGELRFGVLHSLGGWLEFAGDVRGAITAYRLLVTLVEDKSAWSKLSELASRYESFANPELNTQVARLSAHAHRAVTVRRSVLDGGATQNQLVDGEFDTLLSSAVSNVGAVQPREESRNAGMKCLTVAAPNFDAIFATLLRPFREAVTTSSGFASTDIRVALEFSASRSRLERASSKTEPTVGWSRAATALAGNSNESCVGLATPKVPQQHLSDSSRQVGDRVLSSSSPRRTRSSARQRARRQELVQRQEKNEMDERIRSNLALRLISKIQRHVPGLMDQFYATCAKEHLSSKYMTSPLASAAEGCATLALRTGRESTDQKTKSELAMDKVVWCRDECPEEIDDARAFVEAYGDGEVRLHELFRLALRCSSSPCRLEDGTLVALSHEQVDATFAVELAAVLEGSGHSHALDPRSVLVTLEGSTPKTHDGRWKRRLAAFYLRHLRHAPRFEVVQHDIAASFAYHELASRFTWLCALDNEAVSLLNVGHVSCNYVVRHGLLECAEHLRQCLPEHDLVLAHIGQRGDGVLSVRSVSARLVGAEARRRKAVSLEAVGAAAAAASAAVRRPGNAVEDGSREPAPVTGFWTEIYNRFVVTDAPAKNDGAVPVAAFSNFRDLDVAVVDLGRIDIDHNDDESTFLAVALLTCGDRYERADLLLVLTVAVAEQLGQHEMVSGTSAVIRLSSLMTMVPFDKRRASRRCFRMLRSVLAARSVTECAGAVYERLLRCTKQLAQFATVACNAEDLALSEAVSGLVDETGKTNHTVVTPGAARRVHLAACLAYVKRHDVNHDWFFNEVLKSILSTLWAHRDGVETCSAVQPTPFEVPSRSLIDMLVCAERLDREERNLGDIRARTVAIICEVLERMLVATQTCQITLDANESNTLRNMEQNRLSGNGEDDTPIADLEIYAADHGALETAYADFIAEAHTHLSEHHCCDAGEAVFLAGRVNFYLQRVVRSTHVSAATKSTPIAPFHGGRSPFSRRFEVSAAQCICCLFGVKYLTAGSESHRGIAALRQASRRSQASSYVEVSTLLLGVAPHVLYTAQTTRTPQTTTPARRATLSSKRDILVTLDFFAAADPSLLDTCDVLKLCDIDDWFMPSLQCEYIGRQEATWSCVYIDEDNASLPPIVSQARYARDCTPVCDYARCRVAREKLENSVGSAATRTLAEMMTSKLVEVTAQERAAALSLFRLSDRPDRQVFSASAKGTSTDLAKTATIVTVAKGKRLRAYSDPRETLNLETVTWHIRAISASPARCELWIAAARTFEYLASPLLALGPATGFEYNLEPPGVSLLQYATTAFGDAVKLRETAAKVPAGSWTRLDAFSDTWLASLAAAFADARRLIARRCWAVAVRATSRERCWLRAHTRLVGALALPIEAIAIALPHGFSSRGRDAAVSLATALYDALREYKWSAHGSSCCPSIGQDHLPERSRYTSAERALSNACEHACRTAQFSSDKDSYVPSWLEAFLLGKLAWRDRDRPVGSRRTEALDHWRRSLEQASAGPTPPDADVVYRLARARFKCGERASNIVDALRACLRDKPKHARAALALAEALAHGDVQTETRDNVTPVKRMTPDFETIVAARRVLEPMFDKRRPQVIAFCRYECLMAYPGSLDASPRKYDMLRLKYLRAYVKLVAATRDYERLRSLHTQIATSKDRCHFVYAMLQITIDALTWIFLDTSALPLQVSDSDARALPIPDLDARFREAVPRQVKLAYGFYCDTLDTSPLAQAAIMAAHDRPRDVTAAVAAVADAAFVAAVRPYLPADDCGKGAKACFAACLRRWPMLQAALAPGVSKKRRSSPRVTVPHPFF